MTFFRGSKYIGALAIMLTCQLPTKKRQNNYVLPYEISLFQSYILDAPRRSSVMHCLHRRFRVIIASYRLRQKPQHDSGRAKPPPWSGRATLVLLPKQKKNINMARLRPFLYTSVLSATANEKKGIPQSSTIYNTIFTSSGFGWRLQPRSKSFWRQIDFGLDLSRCWVALLPAVLSRHGSGRVCLGAWGFPSASGGLPPRLLLPSGRLG